MTSNKLTLRPILSEPDYSAALKQAEAFFDDEPAPDSAEGAFFDALITLIEAYERKHYPIAPPTPIEAIKFRMEQDGLSVAQVAKVMNVKPNRVYEVFNGERALSLSMIRALHAGLNIPAESLIAPTK